MRAAASRPAVDPRRRGMIAKVKIAQKELGLDDGAYRAVLTRLTGVDSAASCTEAQLGAVLDALKAQGWTPKVVSGSEIGRRTRSASKVGVPPKVRAADHPSAKKARALWLSLYQLGEVRNRSEEALEAFAKRQLGCDRLQWADQGLTYRLIEALKAMAERAGWSQDLAGVPPAMRVAELKRRLANAIKRRLGEPEFEVGWLGHVEQLDQVIAISAARLREVEPASAG